jgi:hypothetical protein
MDGRNLAVLLAAGLLAGCSSSSGSPAPSATVQQPPQTLSSALYPAGSSAARHILANVDPTTVRRRAQGSGTSSSYDDGGWGELLLPAVQPCANGAYSNNCANWGTPQPMRTGGTTIAPGAPDLDLCGDAADYPQTTLGDPVEYPEPLAPTTFSLAYSGSQPLPIISFDTRQFVASLSNGFAANSASASMTLTPELTTSAGRGWLLFSTWSWPADFILIPYQVNEIQIAQSSSPLAVSPGNPGTLGAFDCLQRPMAALMLGSGVTFGSTGDWPVFTTSSTTNVMQATVAATDSRPQAAILVVDDRFGTALTTVTPATPVATLTPVPTPTATPTPGRGDLRPGH